MALQKKSFNDIITFTRSSEGGRFNASGNYEVIPANTPRLDYHPVTKLARGLLCEEPRTNLLINSNDLGTGWNANGSSTIERGITLSPDGLMNGARLYGTSEFYIFQVVPITGQPTITISLYAKQVKPGDAIRLRLFEGGGSQPNGVQTSANITLTDAWTRYELTATLKQTDRTSVQLVILGNVTANGSEAFVWGGQMEVGSFATSLIMTGASQVTRTADLVKVNTLSPWYNPSGGTLYTEFNPGSIGIGDTCVSAWFRGSAAANSIITIRKDGSMDYITGLTTSPDGVVQTRMTVVGKPIPPGALAKAAFSFMPGESALSVNGSAVLKGTIDLMPTPSTLYLGSTGNGQQFLNGHLRAIRYYPRRLTDAELQALTT